MQKGGKVSRFWAACVRKYTLPTNSVSEKKKSDSSLVRNKIISNTRDVRFDEAIVAVQRSVGVRE